MTAPAEVPANFLILSSIPFSCKTYKAPNDAIVLIDPPPITSVSIIFNINTINKIFILNKVNLQKYILLLNIKCEIT